MSKIAVGISGGVDSAVALALLKEQGNEVVGITMSTWSGPDSNKPSNSCYGPDKDEIADAKKVCDHLGVKHIVYNLADKYEENVLSKLRNAYKAGSVPNPCVWCNQTMKFGHLVDVARKELGFEYFATGHYVKKAYIGGRYSIAMHDDTGKDQSYFLYRLSQEQIEQSIFPLANMNKNAVRETARDFHLPVSEKKESQDFYEGNINDILKFPVRTGYVVDIDEKVVGIHEGHWNFTIGQRKGLGLCSCKESKPMYVVEIDSLRNQVVVGYEQDTYSSEIYIDDTNWMLGHLVTYSGFDVMVKIRSGQKPVSGTINVVLNKGIYQEGLHKIIFDNPVRSATIGQSAVFYKDGCVIGGGIICKKPDFV